MVNYNFRRAKRLQQSYAYMTDPENVNSFTTKEKQAIVQKNKMYADRGDRAKSELDRVLQECHRLENYHRDVELMATVRSRFFDEFGEDFEEMQEDDAAMANEGVGNNAPYQPQPSLLSYFDEFNQRCQQEMASVGIIDEYIDATVDM